jgi:hypothetical protein
MAFARDWPRTGRAPDRRLLIPFAILGLLLTALFIGHLRFNARFGSPPALLLFEGLPVAGSRAEAAQQGFTQCIDFKTHMRCRRDGIMLLGHGPFNGAVDLAGGKGRGGFRQLTLWHDRDRRKPSDFARDLEALGWTSCLTMLHNWGDQNILTREGYPVRFSVDLSYYGKRRIRVIPATEPLDVTCESGSAPSVDLADNKKAAAPIAQRPS